MEDTESRILRILQSNPDGVEDQLLTVALKDIDEAQKVISLNRLIDNNRVILFVSGKGQPVYKYQSEDQALKLRDLLPEDVLVYQLIEESRDKGIQTQDLKTKLMPQGFNSAILNKILKNLEKKGLVKKIKSLQQKNRLVWMLMEVEPSSEVTGGMIGQDNFNLKLIEVIQDRVVEYLRKSGQTSYRELSLHIKQIGVIPQGQEFRDEDIKQIIQVLVYDQLIEQTYSLAGPSIQSGENAIYKLSNNKYPHQVYYTQTPCAHCPVRNECGPSNLINPRSCQYLNEWLNA
ncbi:UNKNOWN [Stylonychia lemnae]|uniref:DNA-directed RNA polymerase III subunit RPC6 n=1 Tax=Stylonychia lemnae TaxID=5949 RepID=A0A078A5I3_STYLE|nr:UNKNOWN [Stylonychia lemnae]|eukprot:CDW77495.1 UNKNOWN [Stylonychia lemnae]